MLLTLYGLSPVTCLEVVMLVVAVLGAIGGYHAFNSSAAEAAPADCVTARAETFSTLDAATILRRYGIDSVRAEDFAESFAGPIDFAPVQPTERFFRYYSRGRIGSFLTKTRFASAIQARLALYLPYGNKATFVQDVVPKHASMVLSGGIRFGKKNVEQFLVLQSFCFRFPPGKPVGR